MCEEANVAQWVALETREIIMSGKALGVGLALSTAAVIRGYPEQVAAAYLGLVVKHFRDEVADGRLPMPERYGKRLIWETVVSTVI